MGFGTGRNFGILEFWKKVSFICIFISKRQTRVFFFRGGGEGWCGTRTLQVMLCQNWEMRFVDSDTLKENFDFLF